MWDALTSEYDYRLIQSNIKANYTKYVQLKSNLLFCTFVKRS